ncbi:universal stress protein [Streptomyces cylindrosporus]|uniref:Universal stress protein n=1 Tax=Streptomyces cylindrosporus TaxID=2927583 RepID=A0ABS9YQM1_9ACTN|nr:universal stress protein [Streptomyces cylindrosporus]MCI3278236.1 universal stress protein [Streptomyces cylindrosporus]
MNGPVVVGVDGSWASLAAVQTAALEAERRGTGLRLAHALAWSSARVPAGVPPWDPDGAGRRDLVGRPLDEAERWARKVAPEVTVTGDVLMGDPGRVLESESRTASLAVVAGRRATGIAGRLTGHGRCPLLVVRGRAQRHGCVVLADAASEDAAEFAFAEAAVRNVDLVVLHARARGALAGLRKKYPGVTVHDRRLRRRTGRALVEASDGAQLVVIAAHHRAAELLPGWAGRTLMSRAHCPVAVVPAGKA